MNLLSPSALVSFLLRWVFPVVLLALGMVSLPTVFAQPNPTGFYIESLVAGHEPSFLAGVSVSRCCTPQFPATTVTLVTADGTATAGLDYAAVTVNLTFAVGETTRYVPIPVFNDTLIEGTETLRAFLTNAVGYPLELKRSSATLVIEDNDLGFVVRSAAPDYGYAWEDQGEAHFAVEIAGDFVLATEASVNVATQDITARAGGDYEAVNRRLVLAPGERSKPFTVPLRNNSVADGDRSFDIVLSQPEGTVLAAGSRAMCVIRDNELGYRLGERRERGAAEFKRTVREGVPAPFTLWRDGDYGIASSMRLTLTDFAWDEEGTATAGADYPATNWVVTFGPGEKSRTFTLELPDDGLAEPAETLFVALESLTDGVPVQRDTARVTLLDAEFLPALVDPEFNVEIAFLRDGPPLVATQPDGRVLYAAERVNYDGKAGSVILRVLANGRPDPAWQPFGSPDGFTALALAPDGSVVLGVGETHLVRLTATGGQDPNFIGTDLHSLLGPLLVQPDGRIVVSAYYSATDDYRIVRFLTSGTPDPEFTPITNRDNHPREVALDSAGNLLVTSLPTLGRYRADGTPDRSFSAPNVSDQGEEYYDFHSVVPLPDGKVLVLVNSPVGPLQVRLRSDGSQDPAFPPQPTGELPRLLGQAGTDFPFRLTLATSYSAAFAWSLEQLQSDGTSTSESAPQQILVPDTGNGDIPAGLPVAVFPGPDGSLLVAGSRLVNGQARNGLAKIWPAASIRVVVNPETARVSEAAGLAQVQIFRTGPLTNALTLPWTVEPVTAVPGTDYEPTNGTVIFAPGHRTASLTVSVLDNERPDRDRLIRLRFDAPAGGSAPPPAAFSIANDDPGFLSGGIHRLADGRVRLEVESGAASFPDTGNPWFNDYKRTSVEMGNLGSSGFISLENLDLRHLIYSEVIFNPVEYGEPAPLFFRVVRSELLAP